MTRLQAILRQRCPRCREGKIFRAPMLRGWLAMNSRCPIWRLKFEREQGYFVGAAYVSYGISLLPILLLVIFFWRVVKLQYDRALFAAVGAYLPFVPFVVRMSRVLWMHVDRTLDPDA